MGTGLSIGYVASRTGLAVSAIRFYEEEGLVAPDRDGAGRRVFERGDIRRLSFVLIAQRLGFSLAEIRDALASLPEARNPTREDWALLAGQFLYNRDDKAGALGDGPRYLMGNKHSDI